MIIERNENFRLSKIRKSQNNQIKIKIVKFGR